MDYSEMKATKSESNADKAKNALNSALGSISKPKTTSSTKPRSSTSKSGTAKNSGSKGTTSKSTTGAKNSTSTKKSSTGASSGQKKSSTGANSGQKKSSTSAGSGQKKASTGAASEQKKTSTEPKPRAKKEEPVINITIPVSSTILGTNKKGKNKSKSNKADKPSKSGIAIIIIFVFLAIGIVGGFFATKLICSKDVYEMNTFANGSIDITIGKNEDIQNYTELGVKCISFGKDCSKNYKVSYYYRNKMTEDEILVSSVGEKGEGIYYAVYTSPSKKYSTVKLVRNIIVLRGEDDE